MSDPTDTKTDRAPHTSTENRQKPAAGPPDPNRPTAPAPDRGPGASRRSGRHRPQDPPPKDLAVAAGSGAVQAGMMDLFRPDPGSEDVPKLKTHIEGLDEITMGGIPTGRTTLLAGTSGTAKTVLSAQFIVGGARAGEGGVFVTFEEPPERVRENTRGLGFDIERLEEAGLVAFVDASPQMTGDRVTTGTFDLRALIARIEHAVKKVNATRLAIDSLGALFTQLDDPGAIRNELLRLNKMLAEMNVTTLLTAERWDEYGAISRNGVEEYVVDNILITRNVLEDEKRRRTLEVVKMRGARHQKGEFPFTLVPRVGAVFLPLSSIRLTMASADVRVPSGNEEVDQMCGGGLFRDSIVLVSGATGTGKTLLTLEFIQGGAKNDERCLLFAFEESRDQLNRNARSWSIDLPKMERDGHVKVICAYPEQASLEEIYIAMRDAIEEFDPHRVAVDSLTALERISTPRGFREFVVAITSFLKARQSTGLFTATTSSLAGGPSASERHISTITDTIILLRYIEMMADIRRGIVVLKMRGSAHDKTIREYHIDDRGMRVGKPFRRVAGIISGRPLHVSEPEMDRVESMFSESASSDAEVGGDDRP